MNRKAIARTFTRQHDQSDCGVACLLSVLKYHGGQNNLENLREISGTSKAGTTMLGLYQAANTLGFSAEGFKCGFEQLKEQQHPVILHVVIEKRLQHYIVCYGYDNGKFTIGDPGKGIVHYTTEQLDELWQSKTMLQLIPTDKIEKKEAIKKDKLRWFKETIKEDAGILSIIFFLSLIIAVLGMVMAIFSQKLIDDILPSGNPTKLIISLVLITVLLLFKGATAYLAGFMGIKQGKDFNNRLIGRFYESLLFLPKSFFDNRRIGELVERMNDTSRIQTTITRIVGDLLKNFLLIIIGEVILFIYSPQIGLFSLISLPLFGLISWQYHNGIVKGQREVMTANAHKSSNYVNSINGIDSIKSNHKENAFSEINRIIYGHFQNKVFHLGKLGISLQLTAEIASVFITVALISYGSWLVFNNALTSGELIAVLGISNTIFPAVVSLAFANISLQGAKVAFDRMYDFSAMKPEFHNPTGSVPQTLNNIKDIKVANLSFRFPGRKQLLKNISININKGEIIALLGESGCGKTTFLSIMERFYSPELGKILVNGKNIDKIPIPEWRTKTTMMPQEISLFNGTLIENIALGTSKEEFNKCVDFCVETGFHKYFMEFPQNYSTLLGEEGINISGGQKQLIGLARALWKKPQLLLLDEPTSAMDRNTENFVLSLLENIKKETATILVTHRIKIARFTDRIYILENGETVTTGNHQELMLTENLYSISFNELAAK